MGYPRRRQPFWVVWHARPGASIDDAPLPLKTADRARAIRRVFLEDFHGCATVDDVGERCDELLLLEALTTMASARETVLKALRPVASPAHEHSAPHLRHVSPSLPAG